MVPSIKHKSPRPLSVPAAPLSIVFNIAALRFLSSSLKFFRSHTFSYPSDKLLNSALRLEYFPKFWRPAHIITIPKQNKSPNHPQNRRPISLLDTHGKLLERIILKRLLPYTAKIIPPWQTAFQKGRSINHSILTLVNDITK